MAAIKHNMYDDIINMPRPVSEHFAPMTMEDRAAQFAPFAALPIADPKDEENMP